MISVFELRLLAATESELDSTRFCAKLQSEEVEASTVIMLWCTQCGVFL